MKHDVIKIKAEVKNYLESRGWPNIPNPDEFIMESLQDIFIDLLKRGLVEKDDWGVFRLAAEHRYLESKLGV